jgi:hypothetical protein
MDTAHPALDKTDDDKYVEDDSAGEDGERDGHTRRWVRFVMPVMVEIDCEDDEITSVVTLPSEIRLDRNDHGAVHLRRGLPPPAHRRAAADARPVPRRTGMEACRHPQRFPGQLASCRQLARGLLPARRR